MPPNYNNSLNPKINVKKGEEKKKKNVEENNGICGIGIFRKVSEPILKVIIVPLLLVYIIILLYLAINRTIIDMVYNFLIHPKSEFYYLSIYLVDIVHFFGITFHSNECGYYHRKWYGTDQIRKSIKKYNDNWKSLSERADYVIDRYIFHAPICVFKKLKPVGSKQTYIFNGIALKRNSGFSHYKLYKRLNDGSDSFPNSISSGILNFDDYDDTNDTNDSNLYGNSNHLDDSEYSNHDALHLDGDHVNESIQDENEQITKKNTSLNLKSSDGSIQENIETITNQSTKNINTFKNSSCPYLDVLHKEIKDDPLMPKQLLKTTHKVTKPSTFNPSKKLIVKIKPRKQPVKEEIEENHYKVIRSISSKDTTYIEMVSQAIRDVFPRKDYDDGSLAPIILRLSWHCCATFNKETKKGGSNGATMRFVPEITDEGNTGLDIARAALEPVKHKFPKITYSDLWTLAGKVAIEYMDGPMITWKPGRLDFLDDKYVPPNGNLPFAYKDANHIRETFTRMGFNIQEMVALLGAHTLGRCHKRFSGWEGKWTANPTKFSNDFFVVLLQEDWQVGNVPETGRVQYYNQDKSLMMLNTDLELVRDYEFLIWVKIYAADETRFFQDFSKAFSKLLELGIIRDSNGDVVLPNNLSS